MIDKCHSIFQFKKLFLFALLLVILDKVEAQSGNGKVIYQVERSVNKNDIADSEFNAMRSRFLGNAESLVFQLIFKQNKSLFKIQESLESDQNENFEMKMTKMILRGENEYYFDVTSNLLIEKQEAFGETNYLKKNKDSLKWELTPDTRKISGYLCYKATSNKKGIDKNNKTTNTPIYAWYCPELNFPFGPYEAVGLPGLVLEYSLGDFIWKASSIKLNEEKINFTLPEDIIFTTQEEIDKKTMKRAKSIINN